MESPDDFIRIIQSPQFKERVEKFQELVAEKDIGGIIALVTTPFDIDEDHEEEEVQQQSNTEVQLTSYGEVAIFADGTVVVKYTDPKEGQNPIEILAPGETPKE